MCALWAGLPMARAPRRVLAGVGLRVYLDGALAGGHL